MLLVKVCPLKLDMYVCMYLTDLVVSDGSGTYKPNIGT